MYRLFAILLLSVASLSVYSQDLSKSSIEELEKMKQEAVESENYELAQKISDEIKQRNAISDLKTRYKAELNDAVEKEDYGRAANLKDSISMIEKYESIDSLISEAVANEDYGKAKELKEEREELRGQILGTTNSSTPTNEDTNVDVSEASEPEVDPENDSDNKKGNYFTPEAGDIAQDSEGTDEQGLNPFDRSGRNIGVGLTMSTVAFNNNGDVTMYDQKAGLRCDIADHFFFKKTSQTSGWEGFAMLGLMLNRFEINVGTGVHDYSYWYLTSSWGIRYYNSGFYAMTGPFFDWGFTMKHTSPSGNETDDFELGYVDRSNFGWNTRIGYELDGILFYVDNRHGLMNVEGNDYETKGQTAKTRTWSFGVAWKFNQY